MVKIQRTWVAHAIFVFNILATYGNQTCCPQNINKFEALPGQGFDTIRNREMGRVLQYTYKDCRTTEDGKYLIPDNIYVVAVKDSQLQTTSDFIEHYLNYTSLTSLSFKIGGGLSIKDVGVQASFDTSFLDMKKRQIDQKSFTTRIQMRTTLYITETSPSTALDPGLKAMITRACSAIDEQNPDKAELLCQLMVRNYGTHYVYQAHAGAIFLEEDYVNRDILSNGTVDKFKIGASAGASFFKKFAKAKFSFNVEPAVQQKFESSKTSSLIRSIGGAIVSSNMTVDDWIKEIPNNLVVIDRVGNPLSYLITPEQFPEYSLDTLNTVRNEMDKAVKDYYSYNTHRGCTDMKSPNFEYNANVDDGKCQKPSDNYYFGGGYMTCQSKSNEAGDLCTGLDTKNPLTGDYRCEDGFESALLNSNDLNKRITKNECNWMCFLFICWTNCNDVVSTSHATYNGYWCVAKESPKNNTGFMFGGLYTTWVDNPITKAKNCPVSYISLQLLPNFNVCISNSYDVARDFSSPFGGFFSCAYGNPMTTRLKLGAANGNGYLRTCPNGFSQRMAVIDRECEVNYCVQMNDIAGQIDVVLPPFRSHKALFNATLSKGVEKSRPVSGWAIFGGVVLLVVVAAMVVGGGLYLKKRKKSRAGDNERLVENAGGDGGSVNGTSYGAVNA